MADLQGSVPHRSPNLPGHRIGLCRDRRTPVTRSTQSYACHSKEVNMRRLFTHAVAVIVGATLATGVAAGVASLRHQASIPAAIAKLQRDDVRLKWTVGNLCVWFKHAPAAIQLPSGDQPLATWLYNVGLNCDTFGLH